MARLARPAALMGLTLLAVVSSAAARTAPETTITAGPIGRTADSSPNFAFVSSDPDATFECSLDGAGFSPCTSPKAYAGVTESPHTFAVRSTNGAGETDPTPAERSFIADASVNAAVSAARDQVQDGGHVSVAIRIDTNERLRAAARGTIELEHAKVRLKPDHEHLDAGRFVLRLRPGAPGSVKVARALSQDERARAHVRVELTDAVGNEASSALGVSLSAG